MRSATSKTKAKAPTEQRSQRTRSLILKAGLDCILGGGLGGFTANELMRRTGLSKGALFHHFQSLDEIAMECALLGEHLVVVELKGDFRETLEHMMNVPYAYKRVKALGGMLFFLCEKGRDTLKFKKVMNQLNSHRREAISDMIKGFCPHLADAKLEIATEFLHSAQLGLAGPAGECHNQAMRLIIWGEAVDHLLAITAKR